MAGSYPDAPSRRFAWDADGSVGVVFQPAFPPETFSAASKAELNDEDAVQVDIFSNASAGLYCAVLFPELREVDGFFFALGGDGSGTSATAAVQASTNTTNGRDGSWATVAASYNYVRNPSLSSYRSPTSANESNRRGVRFHWAAWDHSGTTVDEPVSLHLYGTFAAGETPDRLLFIDETTGLEYTAPVDYGDTPRGSSEDRELRIRNNSASLTANTIQYTAEDLYRGAASWYTFTLPGGATFQSTQQVASLAPATSSGIITARRITPASALQLYAARWKVNVGSWS